MGAWRWVLAVAVLTAVVAGASMLLARVAWSRSVDRLGRDIRAHHQPTTPLPPESIPEPVARYLARSIPPPAPTIEYAWLRQAGTFQMGTGEDGWRAFRAEAAFRVHPPAFYWDARIVLVPGLPAFVRDSYVAGAAAMVGKVGGLVTVVDEANSPPLAAGALARYLAEAVWFPPRLAVGPGLEWRPIDAHTAAATLTDGDVSVSLTFTFDDDGDPIRVEGLRDRATDSGFVTTPWIGTFSDHEEVAGFRIPRYGEVGWMIDGELTPYWRGRIEAVEYR